MSSMDAKPFFRTRAHAILATLGGIVVLCFAAGFVVPSVDRFLTGGPVVRRLRRDAKFTIPIGSRRGDVEAWFRRHHIKFDVTVDSENGLVSTWASFPDSDWFIPARIDIEMHFDEHRRLKVMSIEREETWP